MPSDRVFFFYVAVALATIAGCQAPPIRQAPEATPTTHHLRQDPLRAAACIARNVDRYRSRYTAQIRAAQPPATAEVIIRGRETVALARVFAAGQASTVEISRTDEVAHGLDELIEAMLKGC
jgi:hypothetical protein